MRYLTVIPARSGSKGVPGKNIRLHNGKPLLQWTVEAALEENIDQRVVVSTDSDEIAKVALQCGAEVPFLRPSELAGNQAQTEPVLLHALDWFASEGDYLADAVILLQVTSPIRSAARVEQAVRLFETEKADSLVSVTPVDDFLWSESASGPVAYYEYTARPRRQDILGAQHYRENGSIYITKSALLRESMCRLGGKIVLFKMLANESIEIDEPIDFLISELVQRETEH